jgi:lipoyl(octanoyl) transferase
MPLDLLTPRIDSAAANMATDFLMLQHYPTPTHARWRHYGWRQPAITFGYAQKIAEVRAKLPAEAAEWELCRRPTGGGIVDHRDDWTYALVIPAQHDLGAAPAPVSYAAVHQVIADTLQAHGRDAILQPPAEKPADPDGAAVCFTRAEPADVIDATTRTKLAGAAQKRGKRGLLFQGSLTRAAMGAIDEDQFEAELVERLAGLLSLPTQSVPWPEAWDEATDALAENYASAAWLDKR